MSGPIDGAPGEAPSSALRSVRAMRAEVRAALRRTLLELHERDRTHLAVPALLGVSTAIATRRPLGGTRSLALGGLVAAASGWGVVTSHVLTRELRIDARAATAEAYRQSEALAGLYARLRGEAPLPPMRDWALSPDAAAVIVDAVTELRPRTVVELGSGTSTFLLALLARSGSPERILSVDHDAVYLGRTAERLAGAGLDDHVELVHAPLRQVTVEGVTGDWYDVDAVPAPDRVDLLLVDGPPYTFGATVRHPALGWYADRLSPDGVVILDDADRPGEREILRRWRADHDDLVITVLQTEKGTAVVHHRGHRPAFLGPSVEGD